MFTSPKNILPEKEHGFTLIEIIIVIIIVGILAAVGISQYSNLVEKGRIAEAKTRIGVMRQLAYQYYLENGTVAGLTNSDVGVDNTCSSTDYYRYSVWLSTPRLWLGSERCTSGGKTPNSVISYEFALDDTNFPSQPVWKCRKLPNDGTPCYGYPY